jgi:predicted AlkP superfamily pyrophosphatase or phosphodiesterase
MANNNHPREPTRSPKFDVISEQSEFDRQRQGVQRQNSDIAQQPVFNQQEQVVENQINNAGILQYISYYISNGDPTSVITAANRNRSGVPFQAKVLGAWFFLSNAIVVCIAVFQPSSGVAASFPIFFSSIFSTFFACCVYSSIGLLIQYFRCGFTEVRNSWLVWCLYPILSLFGIALWIIWLMLKINFKLLNIRFWP